MSLFTVVCLQTVEAEVVLAETEEAAASGGVGEEVIVEAAAAGSEEEREVVDMEEDTRWEDGKLEKCVFID